MTSTRPNNRRAHSITNDFASKKSDDGSSQEEDMSDPKWVHHIGGAAALRFSARVVEKQEKLLQKQVPGGSSSGAESHPLIMEIENTTTNEPSIRSTSNNSKKKRNWTLWSSDDKQYFFEGLNEFGKDFDAIQNHISLKLKSKRSSLMSKNKDQVRHFYYRTWNKISKFLTFPDMKKAHQELYGLINYGELRKKQRVLNLKTAVKLSELVQKGSTTIKVRGKTFRIKTPVCRALKKLNRLEEPGSKLPNKVTLELIPENGEAWSCVQKLSYNPRVRVHLSLQRSLSSVIKFFEERWKGSEVKMKEQLLQTFGKQIPRLRFIPQSQNYHLPSFKVLEGTSASKISLRNYTDSLLPHERKVSDGGTDHDDNDTEDERMTWCDPLPLPQQQIHQPTTNPSTDQSPVVTTQPIAQAHSSRQEDEDFLSNLNLSSSSACLKGWTLDEAGMITIGEVYLMLGSSSSIQFEYKWDRYESTSTMGTSLIQNLVKVSSLLKKKKGYQHKAKGIGQCPQCGCTSVVKTDGQVTSTATGQHERSGDIPGGPILKKQVPIVLNMDSGNSPGVTTKLGQHQLQFMRTLNLTAQAQEGNNAQKQNNTSNNKSIILLPKGNRRQGRPANKKVIVPRVLPLRPKIDTTGIFTITTTTAQNVMETVQLAHQSLSVAVLQSQAHEASPSVMSPRLLESSGTASITPSEFNELIHLKPSSMSENSNFSLSSFLDITLPSSESSNQGIVGGSCLTSDKFLSCDENSLLNLLDCKQNSSMEKKPEDQMLSNGPWLSSESNDLFLNSLLGNLESSSVGGSTNPTTTDMSNGRDRIVSYLDDEI